mmetsp:Transcript_2185/g.4232  ORF Transcript_2185/g.4232 Transcript_2185/m.4232 type:complete len:511 (-) Transcript_2185:279-1811(-)
MGRRHQFGVVVQDALRAGLLRTRRPRGQSRSELLVRHVHRERARLRVERDDVAVAHQRDWPSDGRLRRDVADHDAVRRAREAAVGHECDVLAQAAADQRAAGHEHLRHAGAALWPFVAHDHHVALADGPADDRFVRVVLLVEAARRAAVVHVLLARELAHGRLRTQVAVQHEDVVASGLERPCDGKENLLPGCQLAESRRRREVLGDCLAGACHAAAVQEARRQQLLHDHRQPALLVDVDHVEFTVRRARSEDGHVPADPVEVVNAELRLWDVRLVRDGEQVQHAVGAPAARVQHRHGVLEGLLRYDLAARPSGGEEAHQRIGRLLAVSPLGGRHAVRVAPRHRGVARAARPRHAHRFDRKGHRRGGEHRRAASAAGRRDALEPCELLNVEQSRRQLRDDLAHRAAVQPPLLAAGAVALGRGEAGQGWAAKERESNHVLPSQRHHHATHALVAAAERHDCVGLVALVHDLDRVADGVAAHERVSHEARALGETIADHWRERVVWLAAALL